MYDKITWFFRKMFHEIVEEEVDGVPTQYLKIKGRGFRKWIGELLSCYWCTGIWCSIFLFVGFYLFQAIFFPIIVVLAIASAQGIIETILEK